MSEKTDTSSAVTAPLPAVHICRARRVRSLMQQIFEVVDDRASDAAAAGIVSHSPRDWHLSGDFALVELLLLRALGHLTQTSETALERELDAKEGRPQ